MSDYTYMRKPHPDVGAGSRWDDELSISQLCGYTATDIKSLGDKLVFVLDDGAEYTMEHVQDCCESVRLEDIAGDLNDLIGTPILHAECVSQYGREDDSDTFTWTFYKLGTIKGFATLRWYGTSNGYYSEEVSFYRSK